MAPMQILNSDELKVVAAGDFHFGNPRLRGDDLYERLRKYLYPELEGAQLLLLTGDIYNQLTTVSSNANYYVMRFIRDIFAISAQTGMQVRILHGTYSHDRDQVRLLEALAYEKTRAKVINNIEGEVLTDWQPTPSTPLRILYLPDNLQYKTSSEVVEHIKDVYTCLGWDKADLILGHGAFAHALNCAEDHLPPCTYTIEQFKPLVTDTGIIVMGHIHTPSHRANVYYCGSFDRMSHGEEENKGFYVFTRKDNRWTSRFCVNQDSYKFITITPQGDTVDQRTTDLANKLHTAFDGIKFGWVRVVYDEPELRGTYQRICASLYPNIIFTGKSSKDTVSSTIELADINLELADDIRPNVNNLGELVYQFLLDTNLIGSTPKDTILTTVNNLLKE